MSDTGTYLAVEAEIVAALSSPALTFNASAYISNATHASPIVGTTVSDHGISNAATVTISGVLGNTAANGTFVITLVDATSFSLNGSTGNADYTSGGVVVFPSAVAVLPSMSLDNLIQRDSLRLPAIGVIFNGTTGATPYAVGSRKLRATTKWRIAVACQNLRGTQYARQDAYALLEGIRDQLHYTHSARSPKAAFMLEEDFCPDSQPEGKITAYADFTLALILGN